MTIKEIITQEKKTAFSFEVLPPLKGNGTKSLFNTIDRLREFNPKYINITNHRSEYIFREKGNGLFERECIRKRPGTVAVAVAIKDRYGIKVVPHLVCSGATRDEIEYTLLDLQFLGITDLLLLRGDKAKEDSVFTPEKNGPCHATDLIDQVNDFNAGHFIDGTSINVPGNFSFGVACYPEKHEEAPNIEQDLYWLKKKALAGAEYAVTQLFFDNQKYFHFVELARKAGITIPIIPGIKPFCKLSQLTIVPRTFHCDFPQELTAEALKCKTDEDAKSLGIEWCVNQCRELMKYGVPSIHFYTVSAVESIHEVAKQIY